MTNTTEELAITARVLRPGDVITEGAIRKGTVASVEVHNWTVTVLYTDGHEHFTSVLAILHIVRPCTEDIGDNAECGEPATEDRGGFALCAKHAARFDGLTALAAKDRLEELRTAIREQNISYGEIAELQSLTEFIEPGDVELAEWAGIPENTDDEEN